MPNVSKQEKDARLELLGDIVFNSSFFQWNALLKFHAAVLSEVNDGHMSWGDDYQRLEQQMLMPFPLNKQKLDKRTDKSNFHKVRDTTQNSMNGVGDRVLYCADYQRKSCEHSESHSGQYYGKSVTLHHICSACWRMSNRKAFHPASSVECPNYEH